MQKTIFFLIALFALAVSAQAAGKGDWHTDFDKAMSVAEKENKIVMVEFHGSDWCPPCIKLNDEILSTEDFQKLAKSSLVLVNADFPRKTKLSEEQQAHNQKLAQRFGIRGFPTVVLLDSEGEVLDRIVGYPRGGLEGFLAFLNKQLPASAAEEG